MFVDGFNVVKQLKKISPEAFRILTAFDVGYCDEGNDAFGEYSLGYSAPVIKYVFGKSYMQCHLKRKDLSVLNCSFCNYFDIDLVF